MRHNSQWGFNSSTRGKNQQYYRWYECNFLNEYCLFSITLHSECLQNVRSLYLNCQSHPKEHSVCWRFSSRDPGFESCIQQRKTTCLNFSKIACLRQSIEINNNKPSIASQGADFNDIFFTKKIYWFSGQWPQWVFRNKASNSKFQMYGILYFMCEVLK